MLSNNPPISERLALENEDLTPLVEAIAARANAAPKVIGSPDDAAVVSQLIVDARKLARDVDARRVNAKAPYLQAGRDVDGFFSPHSDRVGRVATVFQKIADDHARRVADEARRRAAEEARKFRDEQERQAEIARRAAEANRAAVASKAEARIDYLEDRAAIEEAAAAGAAKDLVGTTTFDSGVKSTARDEWTFEIVDYDSIPFDKLRPYLKRDAVDAALRAFVKFHKNANPLAGVRIFAGVKARIR